MSNKETSKQKDRKRLKPISLYPLTPEQALGAFMASKPQDDAKPESHPTKPHGKEG